jgi:tellurite resistance protein TerC
MPSNASGTPVLWGFFGLIVLVMLALDLGVLRRKAREVRFNEALGWSAAWVLCAVGFGAAVYAWFGKQRALEFAAAYLLEKSLSVDNLFVFVLVFGAFAVPRALQHRVLYWGIIGALVMRGVFIALGITLIQRFHWIIYVFGALLVVTAIRLLRQNETEPDPRNSWAYRTFSRLVPSTHEYVGGSFIVRSGGRRLATPLFAVLVVIEVSDVVFAIDSIPAVFAVTTDPFIVYTSNILAILGLRSLYFLLAAVLHRFQHLKFGLAVVLGFVGFKMLASEFIKVPILTSLAVIGGAFGLSIVTSLFATRRSRLAKHPTAVDAGKLEAEAARIASGTRVLNGEPSSWPEEHISEIRR